MLENAGLKPITMTRSIETQMPVPIATLEILAAKVWFHQHFSRIRGIR